MQVSQVPVSVVIPCYNCGDTLGRALRSVYQQTAPPSETIIVNDASDAEAMSSIENTFFNYSGKLNNGKITHLLHQSGPATARNRGWEAAEQPFIAFLDADDTWHPKKIEVQYNWMRRHPKYCLSGHQSIRLLPEQIPPDIPTNFSWRSIKPLRQLVANQFHTRTVMIKRDIPNRFKAGKRYSEDYLLWLEVIFNRGKAAFLDVPLAYTYKRQFGGGGLSGDLWKMEKGELDTYFQIYRMGYISWPLFYILIIQSLLKYLRRAMISHIS